MGANLVRPRILKIERTLAWLFGCTNASTVTNWKLTSENLPVFFNVLGVLSRPSNCLICRCALVYGLFWVWQGDVETILVSEVEKGTSLRLCFCPGITRAIMYATNVLKFVDKLVKRMVKHELNTTIVLNLIRTVPREEAKYLVLAPSLAVWCALAV
jgi:hypothetical protein